MNCKNLIYLFPLLLFTLANAQRQFIKIDDQINNQNLTELEIENKKSSATKHCLDYECNTNLNLYYCSNNSNENYVNFEELGTVKNSNLIVILKTTSNEEFYILLDQEKCKAITLKGFPLKIDNSNQYIVYNNPPTDNPHIIQIVNIINGTVYSR